MELEKLVKFFVEYFSQYLDAFIRTLKTPGRTFEPTVSPEDESNLYESSTTLHPRLQPKLISFTIISVFLGSVLNSQIIGRGPAPDLIVTLVVVIGSWFVFSSIVHLFYRLFGGDRKFVYTLSGCLPIFAITYVLSAFVSFFWGVLLAGLSDSSFSRFALLHLPRFLTNVARKPTNVYFLVQLLFTSVYLLWTMNSIRRPRSSQYQKEKPALFAILSCAESAVFSLSFVFLVILIVAISKSTYDVHRIPLDEPNLEIAEIPLVDFADLRKPHRVQQNLQPGGSAKRTNTDAGDLQARDKDSEQELRNSLWNKYSPPKAGENFKRGTVVFLGDSKLMGVVQDERVFAIKSRHHGVVYGLFDGYWQKRIVGFRSIPNPCKLVLRQTLPDFCEEESSPTKDQSGQPSDTAPTELARVSE